MRAVTDRSLVPLDDDAQLGPAMSALRSERMRRFVCALVQTGCNATAAAKAAGYAPNNHESLKAIAYKLAHDPRVQAAVHEEGQKIIRIHGPMAIGVLVTVAKDKAMPGRDRVKAAEALLNRGGFHTVSEQHVQVTDLSETQLDAKLKSLCRELGLDEAAQRKLLDGKTIDAVFTDVTPAGEFDLVTADDVKP